jgi:hypothetical protein
MGKPFKAIKVTDNTGWEQSTGESGTSMGISRDVGPHTMPFW